MIHKIEGKWGYLNTCPTVPEDQRYPGTVGEKRKRKERKRTAKQRA
jgi:hypothetical protein